MVGLSMLEWTGKDEEKKIFDEKGAQRSSNDMRPLSNTKYFKLKKIHKPIAGISWIVKKNINILLVDKAVIFLFVCLTLFYPLL